MHQGRYPVIIKQVLIATRRSRCIRRGRRRGVGRREDVAVAGIKAGEQRGNIGEHDRSMRARGRTRPIAALIAANVIEARSACLGEGTSVRARVVAVAFALSFLPLTAAPGSAQAPPASSTAPLPASGFMTPPQITRIVRSAGFDPLAPPLREGSTYVLRATDYRGILMRVVVDARSGAIRAVNRIVAGPGPIGPIGMMPPP